MIKGRKVSSVNNFLKYPPHFPLGVLDGLFVMRLNYDGQLINYSLLARDCYWEEEADQ